MQKGAFIHTLNIKSLHQTSLGLSLCFFCFVFFFFALLEGQPAFRVVDEDLVHLVLRDAPRQHLRHDVLQDVGVAVAAVLGEAVLGVDVVRDHDIVLVALLHEERQSERPERQRERDRERERERDRERDVKTLTDRFS